MIAVVFLFGPSHGKLAFTRDRPQDQLYTIEDEEHRAMFQEYRFGEPYGILRPSMVDASMRRHVYRLHDIIENGVEECAIYFHGEECCDKGYEHSREYKEADPEGKNRPRIKDTSDYQPRVRRLRGDIW